MKLFPKLIAGAAALFMLVAPAVAADRAIIILDASGSMWAQIDGQSRIAIARDTLNSVLKGIPASLELGLMAYGHREKASCTDIELLVPPAAGTAGAISAAAAKINPKGKTPLSAAVQQAADLLKYTEDKATVILITDGLETCDADPCALGTTLKQAGVDFTVDVVGFGLTASEGKQVACLADNTGGKYFQAKDAKGLTAALTQTVAQVTQAPKPQPKPEPPAPVNAEFSLVPELVLSEGGPAIKDDAPRWDIFAVNADGSKGDTLDTEYGAPSKFKLAAGSYIVKASWDQAATEQPVTIVAGQVATPVFNLNAGRLILHPRPAEGLDVDDGAAVKIEYPSDNTTSYGNTKLVVPAGDEKVTASLDAGASTLELTLAAGQTIEKDLIIGVGHITANATYAEGGDKVTDGGLTFDVKKAKKKIDGTREDVGTNYGPDTKRWLPPGDYVVEVTMDQAHVEIPITVTAGGETSVDAVLNAGVAAITTDGAKKIEVFGTKKNIKGERPAFSYGYDPTLQTTLPAGDYVAVATVDDAGKTVETPFSVKAGERTEVTVSP
jgi:Ca-activated chloride channel family protein